jgi:hypothetical protein
MESQQRQECSNTHQSSRLCYRWLWLLPFLACMVPYGWAAFELGVRHARAPETVALPRPQELAEGIAEAKAEDLAFAERFAKAKTEDPEFGTRVTRAERERACVAALRKRAQVIYDYWDPDRPETPPPGPTWQRVLFGLDFVCHAMVVKGSLEDADVPLLAQLSELKELDLLNAHITDEGLRGVGRLPTIDTLHILNCRDITDAGIVYLKALKNLDYLELWGENITDVGVAHLKGMSWLRCLSLYRTQVTDVGLKHLEKLTGLERLELGSTKVTDAGLEYLKGLTHLRNLEIQGTQVTAEGAKKLKDALPNCYIFHGDWAL